MDKQQFINQATKYTHNGWNPVCIYRPEKYPLNYGWQRLQNCEVTEEDIHSMANKIKEYTPENMNIGIITGAISNLIVLDVDGDEGFQALKEHGIALPDTLRVSTGRGMHYYFQHTVHPALKNAAGYLPKVDIRTDGGLVVAPPSIHPSGRLYEWVNPDADILPFPEDLINLFAMVTSAKSPKNSKDDKGIPLEQRAVDGCRNHSLFKAASAMQGIGFSEEVIRDAIIKQNELLSEPLSDKELELTVFSSVFKYSISSEIRGLYDYDNALRMKDLYSNQLVYVPERDVWKIYNGKHWVPDTVMRSVREKFIAMSHTIPREVPMPDEEDKDAMKAYDKRIAYAYSCRDIRRFKNALPDMQSLMAKHIHEFDNHDELLCLENGVLNIRTKELLPHEPKYYLSVMSDLKYDKDAESELWESYLNDVFGDDVELRRYVQKSVGYTLTGHNKEKAFFILKGESNSGKSVFLNVIGHVLGGFYKKANTDTFLYKSGSNATAPRPDLSSMVNKRLVVASETNEGDRFDEKLIKDITGGEPITCRDLFKPEFSYIPTFKIWLSTNTLPAVRDDSNGVWNRVKVIPFNYVIPDSKIDIHLTEKLCRDASAILNWCVEGYQMYLEEGLTEPQAIMDELEVYKEENDVFGGFIDDYLVLDKDAMIERPVLFELFQEWCERTNTYQRGMSNRKFFKKMRDRGFVEKRTADGRFFAGLAVKTPNSSIKGKDGNTTFVEF